MLVTVFIVQPDANTNFYLVKEASDLVYKLKSGLKPKQTGKNNKL